MCGITGFFSYNNKVNTKKYYEAHTKIAHRGPDDEGFIYKASDNRIKHLKGNDTVTALQDREHINEQEDTTLILGHRRLSIIDLSEHGHQPYTYENLYMVYNGEIYNYIELRVELVSLGYDFDTDSDTEVFIKAYHCWGVLAFNKFNGMWACAIYDIEGDDLILVRDRFGIKPLYYSFLNGDFIFGSEIKFVASFFESLNPNEQMVYEYLRFNYIDHTNQTLFKDIMQLEPNSYMKVSKDGLKVSEYWSLSEGADVSKEDIEKRLETAISLRMRSDVEVGSLLSGGIDSSAILGIINHKQYAEKFQTFSAVFKEEKFSEKQYIDKFKASNLTLKKHFIYPDANTLVESIDELIYTQEEPFRSLAVLSQFEIYKYIKKNTNTTVLLNGQGADEIFTGYTEYHYVYFIELVRSMKFVLLFRELKAFQQNRNLTTIKLMTELGKNLFFQSFSKGDKYKIFTKKFSLKRKENMFTNRLKNALWNSLTFSALREYLRYEDKNSMNFSLESRLPFLDFNLVQSAFSLDDQEKIYNGTSKYVLREIIKDKVPNETLNRKDKMGFVSPQEEWQKTILTEEFDREFEEIKEKGIFDFLDANRIYLLYQNYKENNMSDWAVVWRIYVLYRWKEVWKVQ